MHLLLAVSLFVLNSVPTLILNRSFQPCICALAISSRANAMLQFNLTYAALELRGRPNIAH